MVKEKSPKIAKAKEVKKTVPIHQAERYVEAVGRRKTAVARVRLFHEKKDKGLHLTVNGRELAQYFPLRKLQEVARAPFGAVALEDATVSAKVAGGGVSAQAEAVRLGISRALLSVNPELRSRLKALGYLKRDPRMVERKKPGLRKARRPQQWRKR
ncbi:30S ribosomal protein S9 [Candidatus Jorgensenbacteria bacterium CG10_big_fil_rev_8_21_14_0_10_54_38]|uniref:30S ribosomal protein S9 n=2 Tax=Candidatus Joergenseniibacteriota TaxID=1752739 RepID=A0A2M6WGH7_9BACT|nr:MAG: 30S ribosomal protein S9 [Candidatus Jorgensenbacteria bacterium CG23_combo_of_CG06-09_8_20_14_all_54_14]PIT91889.1 MAG: 30S ribosomal protein S9 [Candidatus Jorgensenbacteria bacterium CG10_big_fil_rev_8_21_14_0_10_54_38]